jgi:hypothetical protein
MDRPLTAAEKAKERAARMKAQKDAARIAEGLKWRDVDLSKEVFLIDEMAPVNQWTTFKLRNSAFLTTHIIFRTFFTDSIVDRLGNDADEKEFVSGVR